MHRPHAVLLTCLNSWLAAVTEQLMQCILSFSLTPPLRSFHFLRSQNQFITQNAIQFPPSPVSLESGWVSCWRGTVIYHNLCWSCIRINPIKRQNLLFFTFDVCNTNFVKRIRILDWFVRGTAFFTLLCLILYFGSSPFSCSDKWLKLKGYVRGLGACSKN